VRTPGVVWHPETKAIPRGSIVYVMVLVAGTGIHTINPGMRQVCRRDCRPSRHLQAAGIAADRGIRRVAQQASIVPAQSAGGIPAGPESIPSRQAAGSRQAYAGRQAR